MTLTVPAASVDQDQTDLELSLKVMNTPKQLLAMKLLLGYQSRRGLHKFHVSITVKTQ